MPVELKQVRSSTIQRHSNHHAGVLLPSSPLRSLLSGYYYQDIHYIPLPFTLEYPALVVVRDSDHYRVCPLEEVRLCLKIPFVSSSRAGLN